MKIPYYIFSTGYLHRKHNTLHLEPKKSIDTLYGDKEHAASVMTEQNERSFLPREYLPVHQVESLYCFGETAFSSPVLRLMGREGIPVHFFDFYGMYYGSFYSRESDQSAPVVLSQARHYLDVQRRLKMVRTLVGASLNNMDRLLDCYDTEQCNLTRQRMHIKEMQSDVGAATSIKRIGGAEGFARRCYYAAMKKIVDPVRFEGRVVRPPDCLINALLSFGYALLYTQLTSEAFRAGLSPFISFVHEPRERRCSLSLDLADIFKPLMVDRLVIDLVRQGAITEHTHAQRRNDGVYLTLEGTKIFAARYDQWLRNTLHHPRYKRSVSLRALLRLECTHLAAYIHQGTPYEPCTLWR